MKKLDCFKAYDIRGRLLDELNADIAWAIGRAVSEYLKPGTVVVGGDIRLSTPELKTALSDGLRSGGTDVIDIGLCGTEEIYFATSHLKVDGGIMVTASHNPIDYNGMKLVREESKPISGDTGLREIQQIAEQIYFGDVHPEKELKGAYTQRSVLTAYIQHILGYINTDNLQPIKLVVNAGNGAAGHVVDAIEHQFKELNVPVEFIKIHHEPDGTFPHGIPNPLLHECRAATAEAVIKHKADMGIAWDGDFDRCFLFDENGQFIEGYYIVGLLGEAFLAHYPGAKILHDPRLTWNTIDQISAAGGTPVLCKTGHAFIKERMRQEDAIYGGEMSAHHYFRDFAYCDSGMIPWLLVAELMARKGLPLSELVANRIALFPSSGEINSKVENASEVIESILNTYQGDAVEIDYTDGISLDMGEWRFNLRTSNTEPVLRLNVESRGDSLLMEEKTTDLLAMIRR
ncbi:phosphomannomutase [Parendozoicomonas haliclonae]|uniref:phosphomannomutase n=1 Tax=Parendozoicomonas haliclonae TaxID=1960125 RepID=A0A1X7ARW7_9GAMM|nr:phosphomannomutase [Parendozoicomonas haliclonae]SMA50882.1 Phosphomannomutase/phosphoglucomutase [Parendozoicomonas haliclonae]